MVVSGPRTFTRFAPNHFFSLCYKNLNTIEQQLKTFLEELIEDNKKTTEQVHSRILYKEKDETLIDISLPSYNIQNIKQ